ncbi:MAG TPA: hypothetical protein VHD57_03620 [Vicinamibacterales bacterium]|nr:hypothetical protein [Vicinamibacterales bacterium]
MPHSSHARLTLKTRAAVTSVAVFLLVGVVVDQRNHPAGPSRMDPRIAIDPFELQQRIAGRSNVDLAAIWRSLGLSSRLDTVDARRDPAHATGAPQFTRCHVECVAEITRDNIDADPAQELILKICEPYGFCRFLFFKARGGAPSSWAILGHADHDFARQALPSYTVKTFGEKRFFVMTAEGTSGTGVSLDYARWFETTPTGVREVLTLPEHGYAMLSSRSVGRRFRTDVSSYESDADGDRFDIAFTVDYIGDNALVDPAASAQIPLFTRARRAVYARARSELPFTLDISRSTITPSEIDSVFVPDEIGCSNFLQINMSDLVPLAGRASTPAADWLRRYATDCRASDARTTLLRILNR